MIASIRNMVVQQWLVATTTSQPPSMHHLHLRSNESETLLIVHKISLHVYSIPLCVYLICAHIYVCNEPIELHMYFDLLIHLIFVFWLVDLFGSFVCQFIHSSIQTLVRIYVLIQVHMHKLQYVCSSKYKNLKKKKKKKTLMAFPWLNHARLCHHRSDWGWCLGWCRDSLPPVDFRPTRLWDALSRVNETNESLRQTNQHNLQSGDAMARWNKF